MFCSACREVNDDGARCIIDSVICGGVDRQQRRDALAALPSLKPKRREQESAIQIRVDDFR